MDNFDFLQLNRAVWISYIKQEDIINALKFYNEYINNLKNLKNFKNYKDLVNKELAFSEKIFIEKIIDLGNQYMAENNFAKAVIAYDVAFSINNKEIISYIDNYVRCFDELEQFDLEISLLRYLEKMSINNTELYKLIALAYDRQKSYLSAISNLNKYIESKGNKASADDYNMLGCIYDKYFSQVTHKREDVNLSIKAFEKASDMAPNVRLFAKNVTIVAGKGNDYEAGRKYWDRLLKIDQMNNDDKYDYAAFALKTGDFSEWHNYFDFRFLKENNATYLPAIDGHKWDGSKDLSSSTLLIYCEQGFGDTFLMWGYISRLVEFTEHIIFVVQNEIFELLKDNEFGVEVYSRDNVDLKSLDYDYYIPAMSIPIMLRLKRDNISVGEGYIHPDELLIDKFKEKYFNNNKFKIGISFAGNTTGNTTRDINIEEFLPLDKLNNIEIYNLTKGFDNSTFDIFKNHKVVNIGNIVNNFADTAAAIANCDIVLTADNCILNLAGAIGVKTFAIFNWSYEFRWFDLTGDNVVWYTCVKPFVCDDIDNWQSAIIPAVNEIKKLSNI